MELQTYVRYNLWANTRIAAVLDELSDETLDLPLRSSFPSIRKTAFHIWDAEYLWLQRLQGISMTTWPSQSFAPGTRPSGFTAMSREFMEFVEKQDAAFFDTVIAYTSVKGEPFAMERSKMIFHCMNHSTFHRGQLITMIREAGWEGKLPGTDLVLYFREMDQASS